MSCPLPPVASRPYNGSLPTPGNPSANTPPAGQPNAQVAGASGSSHQQQQTLAQARPPVPALLSPYDPSEKMMQSYSRLSVSVLVQRVRTHNVKIFASYGFQGKKMCEKIDNTLRNMGLELLKNTRVMHNPTAVLPFLKSGILKTDYTLCIIDDAYLKSCTGLAEIVTVMKDPYWRSRVFPLVLQNTSLDDASIQSYVNHWVLMAEWSEKACQDPIEIALYKDGARKMASFLMFVNQAKIDCREIDTEAQSNFALTHILVNILTSILAREESRKAFKAKQEEQRTACQDADADSLAMVKIISLERVLNENPNAVQLLQFCSYLSQGNIPHNVLEAWLKMKNKQAKALDCQEALNFLEFHGLISQKIEQVEWGCGNWISIHPLIQSAARALYKLDVDASTIRFGAEALIAQLGPDVVTEEDKEDVRWLIENAKALVSHASEQKIQKNEIGQLANKIVEYHRLLKDGSQARKYIEMALEICNACNGTENHPLAVDCYTNIGLLLSDEGDCNGAVSTLERALNIRAATVSTENKILLAENLDNLGRALQAQGNFTKAKECYEKSLELKMARLPTPHPIIADSYRMLGSVHYCLKDYPKSLEYFEVELRNRIVYFQGTLDISLANAYVNLGDFYLFQNRPHQAKDHFLQAKVVFEALAPGKHTAFIDGKILSCNTRR